MLSLFDNIAATKITLASMFFALFLLTRYFYRIIFLLIFYQCGCKLLGSISCKGGCRDNASIARFFRSLIHEQLNEETFKTKKTAELKTLDYIAYYNGKRLHSVNGYLSAIHYGNKVTNKVSCFIDHYSVITLVLRLL